MGKLVRIKHNNPITQYRKFIDMSKKKGVLQKISLISAILSYVLAIVTGVFLYLRLESVGSDNPISASLMASTFFFITVGITLNFIGKADIPSFKIDSSEEQ